MRLVHVYMSNDVTYEEECFASLAVWRLSIFAHWRAQGPPKEQGKPKEWRNPFLPYEEDLYVRHLEPNHVLLLNKFNVVENHLLVVTREFESRQTPSTPTTLLRCGRWVTVVGVNQSTTIWF